MRGLITASAMLAFFALGLLPGIWAVAVLVALALCWGLYVTGETDGTI